jgi:hypothetical protein
VKLLDESKQHTSRLKDFAVWKRRFSDEFNYAPAVGPRRGAAEAGGLRGAVLPDVMIDCNFHRGSEVVE